MHSSFGQPKAVLTCSRKLIRPESPSPNCLSHGYTFHNLKLLVSSLVQPLFPGCIFFSSAHCIVCFTSPNILHPGGCRLEFSFPNLSAWPVLTICLSEDDRPLGGPYRAQQVLFSPSPERPRGRPANGP
jgi:hypothetical protein